MGRRRVRDVARVGRQSLGRVVVVTQVGEQVDGPLVTEALDLVPGVRIQRVQHEGGRHDEDPPVAVHLTVGHALAVVLPHRVLPPLGGGLPERPERFAGCRVDRDDGAPLPGHAVQSAVDVDRSRAEDVVGRGSKVVALPYPGDLELLEVGRVDLVERRVVRTPGVTAPVAPLTVLRAGLLRAKRRDSTEPDRHQTQRQQPRLVPCQSKHAHTHLSVFLEERHVLRGGVTPPSPTKKKPFEIRK